MLELGQKLLDDFDGVADNFVLRSAEDGSIRVLVDSDDALRAADAGKMLDGTRNANTHKELGRNRHAGLTDLVAILLPACLYNGTRATKLGTQGIGEFSHQGQILLGANASAHHDQALSIGN